MSQVAGMLGARKLDLKLVEALCLTVYPMCHVVEKVDKRVMMGLSPMGSMEVCLCTVCGRTDAIQDAVGQPTRCG